MEKKKTLVNHVTQTNSLLISVLICSTTVMNNVDIAATLSARLSEVTGLDTTERFPHHSSGEPFHVSV